MNVEIKNHLLFIDGKQVPFHNTPNKGGAISPKYTVIHYTADGSPQQTINWFMSSAAGVSAHLLIDREGKAYQFAPFNIKTWHAGESEWAGLKGLNSYSVGIELTNLGRSAKAKDGFVSATHKNESTPAYWQPYTPKQIDTCTAVVAALRSAYGLIDVIGHDDIAPKRKTDPGPLFDMVKLREGAGFGGKVYETTADLNMRKGADTTYTIITVLPKGTGVSLISENGAWYNVKSGELTGWVSSKYLKLK